MLQLGASGSGLGFKNFVQTAFCCVKQKPAGVVMTIEDQTRISRGVGFMDVVTFLILSSWLPPQEGRSGFGCS